MEAADRNSNPLHEEDRVRLNVVGRVSGIVRSEDMHHVVIEVEAVGDCEAESLIDPNEGVEYTISCNSKLVEKLEGLNDPPIEKGG